METEDPSPQFTMLASRSTSIWSLWSLFTWTTRDYPPSPSQEPPRLVKISEYEETCSRRHPQPEDVAPSRRAVSTPIPMDYGPIRTTSLKRKPTIQRLRSLVSHFKPSQPKYNTTTEAKSYVRRKCCALCHEEIDDDLKYATKAKIIQYDGTYISTRCCQHFVHSSCYRINLQYFIDSKGRPRCPICRDYPDLYVACWALGYVFDKDVGDIDDDECYCPPGIVCEVCEGRKQLLEDLKASSLGQERDDDSLSERLWTIEEVDEEDEKAYG